MKKFLLVFFFILSLILITLLFVFQKQNPSQINIPQYPTPTPFPGSSFTPRNINYSAIFPNSDIAKAVTSVLKDSTQSAQVDGYTVFYFPTDISSRPNQVYVKNHIAQYVLQEETGDNTDFSTFLSSHDVSQGFQLYDLSNTGSGFLWYVFPQDGIAYLANKDEGYALQVLYFPHTTKGVFMQTTGKTFHLLETNPDNGTESFGANP